MSKDFRGMPAKMANAENAGNVKLIQTFKPLPWQKEFLDNTDPVLLLSGSAGGGKSRVVAEKIHAVCLKYPGTEAIIARKIKDDVLRSAKILLEAEVIGRDPRVKVNADTIDYNNGSKIYLIGMRGKREREAVRSIGKGSVDIVWMEEAHEFIAKDFDELKGRIRGTHMGWSQIVLSTNPKVPLHWIRLRLILGKEATVFISKESDNPYNSRRYREFLETLDGVEGQRLRDGLWVDTTGLVIDTWKDDYDNDASNHVPKGNVTLDAEYNPNGGAIEIWADDGYAGEFDQKTGFFTERSHPRVFLLVQQTTRGEFNIFAESYAVQTLEEEHLDILMKEMEIHGWPLPWRGIYDSAAPSLGKHLRNWGVRDVQTGTKNLDDSIRVTRAACSPDRNGVTKVRVHPRCKMLRMEMASWTWDENTGRPGKYQDNGPDAVRYGVYNYLGDADIESNVGVGGDALTDDVMLMWKLKEKQIEEEYAKFVERVGIRV